MSSDPEFVEPAVTGQDGGLVRLRFEFGYEGTDFAGWARQPGRRTVQETIETALDTVLRVGGRSGGPPVSFTVAGRTDAGVHARGQVAHVDVPDRAPVLASLVRRLNGVLPNDVRVFRVALAPAGFDARFSALARRYAYRIADGPCDPLRRRDTLTWPRRLDHAAVRAASPALLGEHDFAAFCRAREGATTVRRLLRFEWTRDEDGVLTAWVVADAFCHSMVRSLVGAGLAVGDGRRPTGWPAAVLQRAERDPSVYVAPAHGLTLLGVEYPPDAELAARAAVTRRVRQPAPGRAAVTAQRMAQGELQPGRRLGHSRPSSGRPRHRFPG